jgi:hypothetical protein
MRQERYLVAAALHLLQPEKNSLLGSGIYYVGNPCMLAVPKFKTNEVVSYSVGMVVCGKGR